LTIPVEAAARRRHRIQKEPEAQIPEEGEVPQGRGHDGEEKRVACYGEMGIEGLKALIKFRTQSPCFKEKSLNVLREEALSELYFWK
jgi:hypothetical protein